MFFLLNMLVFCILMGLALNAYQHQKLWLCLIPHIILRLGKGKSFIVQWLIYAPLFVGWLLLCHWVDVKQWHGVAAAAMGFGMLLGLQAMKHCEEQQKIMKQRR